MSGNLTSYEINKLLPKIDSVPPDMDDYTDTIDFKVQEKTKLTIDEIDRHPLMVKAREFLLTETK